MERDKGLRGSELAKVTTNLELMRENANETFAALKDDRASRFKFFLMELLSKSVGAVLRGTEFVGFPRLIERRHGDSDVSALPVAATKTPPPSFPPPGTAPRLGDFCKA